MNNPSRRTLLLLALFPVFSPLPARAAEDEHAIAHLMKSMFDQPDNPLSVSPIVVRGNDAIADWIQGDKGGRALLWRVKGQWQIRLCSGDGLKDPKLLEDANISPEDARALLHDLAAAESKLAPEIIAKLASFEGTMMIDPGAAHHNHGTATQQ